MKPLPALPQQIPILKRIFDTIGVDATVAEQLLNNVSASATYVPLNKDYQILVLDFVTVISQRKSGKAGLMPWRTMYGHGISWPDMIILFFSDPEWTEKQFRIHGDCVELGRRGG